MLVYAAMHIINRPGYELLIVKHQQSALPTNQKNKVISNWYL
ncbi:hypothetical protein OK016_16575 [Vibrio chagasii]|nr:hypothetical protein [Vibrio chagasii]